MNGSAAAPQMPGGLGFSDRAIGLGAGVFFLGYVLLEIPGALIAERRSARLWFARFMISWGILTVLMAFIHTFRGFYIFPSLLLPAAPRSFPPPLFHFPPCFPAPSPP